MANLLYLPDPGAWPSTLPDTPVTPRDTLNASATSVVDTQASVSAENAPLRVIYGEVRLGPLICTVLPYLQGNVILAVWGHGEVDEIVSLSIDDVEIALGSITTLPTLGKDGTFTGGGTTPINGNVRNYTGKTAQTADTLLIAAFAGQGLTYADNLPGICYSVIYVPTGTSTGFPRINAKIRGLKVWTGATTEWSDNPAYCLADFITNATYGAKRTVDWASVASVAADCSALVGGEKRRTLNLALETVQPVQNWLDTLRTYAGCWITQDGANLKLIADKAGSVVASISHAAGQIKTIGQVKKRGVQSVPTVMSLTYTDTTALPHKPGTVTVYAAGVLAGTTPRRESTVSLPGVTRYSQATREATERLNKLTLNDLSMTLGVFDYALSLEVGDIVEVTHPIGFTAKKLRVQSVVGEYGRFELGLLEYDPAVYSDSVATAPTWADTDLPDPVAEFADTALALVPFEPGPQGPPGADGSDGAPGSNGVRGTRQLYLSDAAYVSGYASYNATATSAIATATTGTTPTTPIRGDTVTFTNGTNYTYTITYNGSAWEPPGLVLDGSLLVTGSVTASKIDTRGLDIKDAAGNVVFSSGSGLSSALVSGLGSLATQNTVAAASVTGLGALATQSTVAAGSVTGLGSLATQNTVAVGSVTGLGALATQSTVAVGSVTGLGALATQSYATVGSTVKMPDGAVMNTSDFVNRLSQLTSGNVSTFIAAAAIGDAYIGNLNASKINAGYISADRIQAGTVTAEKIDSRGLSIKDASGNIILAAGSPLSVASISGLGSLATQSTVGVGSVTGLGALATQSTVGVGSVTGLGSFATLSQINSSNVSTYIASAAIQSAQVGSLSADVINAGTLNVDRINAGSIVTSKLNDGAITTVKITDNSVTVPLTRYWASGSYDTLTGTGAAAGVQLVSSGSPRVADVPSITTPSGASAFVEMKLSLECALVYGIWHKIDFLVDGGVVASKYFTPPPVNGHAVITHDLTSSAGTHTYGVNLIYYGGSGQICSYIYNFNFTVKATFK